MVHNQCAQYLGFNSSSKCGSPDVLERRKKNPATHAMNYLIAACSEFASGSTHRRSFLCAARAANASLLPELAAATPAEMLLAVTRSACSTGVAHTFLRISNINEAALGVNAQRVACNPKGNSRAPPFLPPEEEDGAATEEIRRKFTPKTQHR